jgi:hypothetical protein
MQKDLYRQERPFDAIPGISKASSTDFSKEIKLVALAKFVQKKIKGNYWFICL